MPGTGNYSGSNVDSTYLFDVGVALYQLQDNTSQLIDPKDIRDSVWTLWNRIDDVQIIASMSATSSFFTNPAPTTVTVGGIPAGSTFPGTYSLKQMFDLLLYPYTPPVLSIVASNTPRQYGSGLSVNLDWSVQKKAQNITSVTVAGYTETITGGGAVNQSGTRTINATHSLNFNSLTNETQTFTMSVVDASLAVQEKSTSINWRHKMYWGRINLSSIGNPNLTTNPGQAATVAGLCTDPAIRALNGAAVSPGYALATSYVRNLNGISGTGQYIIIAFPTAFKTAAGRDPVFKINGAPNSAFTKVRDNSTLVTDTGLSISYDVWVTNTAQNSPIDVFDVT
jgi:hypothetical protein